MYKAKKASTNQVDEINLTSQSMPGAKKKKIQGSVKKATKKDRWELKANKKKAYKIYSWGETILVYLLIKLPISNGGELHELNYDNRHLN